MADLAVWQRTIVDEKGDIIPGAEVSVRSYPGGSLITLYEGPDGTQVKGNPFNTGADGFARFWAESQRAEIVAHGAGSTIRWIVDLLNADEVIGDAVSEATAAAADAVSEAKAEADRAEAARDAAQLNAGIYEDTTAGLAATTDGDYFSVPSPDDDEYLILYRNDSGSAVEVEKYPSAKVVQDTRDALDRRVGERLDDDDAIRFLSSLRQVIGRVSPEETDLPGFSRIQGDSSSFTLLNELRQVLLSWDGDVITLGPLKITEDGIPGFSWSQGASSSFALLNELRQVVLGWDGGVITLGPLKITEDGIEGLEPIDPPDDEPESIGQLLLPTSLRMASESRYTFFPKSMFSNRTDKEQAVVSMASSPGAPAPAWIEESRYSGIEVNPERLGASIEISARPIGSYHLHHASLPVAVKEVPFVGTPAPKILALGDSITDDGTDMVHDVLAGWGASPQWIGTLTGSSVVHEGRRSWATDDYLNTPEAQVIQSVLAPGDEADYLAMGKNSRRHINVFLNGNGEFDLGFYLSRFGLDTPEIVLFNLGMNDVSDFQDAGPDHVSAHYGIILDGIRAALPNAEIVCWLTQFGRAAPSNWRIEYLPKTLVRIMEIVRDRIDDGDTRLHLAPVWAAQVPDVGFKMATGTYDPITGTSYTTVQDAIHPDGAARRVQADILAGTIATLI